jgi:DNA gyrase subunit B
VSENEAARAERYTSDSIEVLEWFEAIRKRPGMHVGDPHDGSGLHNMLGMLIENVRVQHVEKKCFHIAVTLHPSGAVTVEDDGPGIPVGLVTARGREQLSFAELLFTSPHRARPPSIDATFAFPWVNALSEYLLLEIERDGAVHRLDFRRGKVDSPLRRAGSTARSGTRITMCPDTSIFKSTAFEARRVGDMLREMTFLNPGLRAELTDQRGHREAFCSRGIDEWAARLTSDVDAFPSGGPLRFLGVRAGVSVDVAMRWTRSREMRIRSFANQKRVHTGAHLAGLFAALDASDVPRHGLVAVLDVRGDTLQIEGCCRERLLDNDVSAAVCTIVSTGLAGALAPNGTRASWWGCPHVPTRS